MRKQSQKSNGGQRNAGCTRRQPSNCLLHPEQTRDGAVRFPIYGSNFKGAVWIPPPQQPELIAPNKPSGKGLIQRRTRRQPAFRMALAFRLALMLTRCSCSSGAPFRLAPTPTRCPCLPASLVSPGAHTRSSLMLGLMSMLAWRSLPLVVVFARRSCSPDVHVSPNVHAHLRLMLHPMLEGDRSDTYRARTSEINPPWQETCNMHDFGTPDAK